MNKIDEESLARWFEDRLARPDEPTIKCLGCGRNCPIDKSVDGDVEAACPLHGRIQMKVFKCAACGASLIGHGSIDEKTKAIPDPPHWRRTPKGRLSCDKKECWERLNRMDVEETGWQNKKIAEKMESLASKSLLRKRGEPGARGEVEGGNQEPEWQDRVMKEKMSRLPRR